MRISVRVKPNARKNEVKDLGGGKYLVSVTAPPVDGRANEKIVDVLAEYFHRPKRAVTIVHGAGRKEKVVEIA